MKHLTPLIPSVSNPVGERKRGKWGFFVLWLALLVTGCGAETIELESIHAPFQPDLPPGIPAMPAPPDDPLTKAKIELGRSLFYDPILSLDSTISCASCHHQSIAFSDFGAVSVGLEGRRGFRNAPPLFNLAWHESFNKDGGTRTLEIQMEVPLTDSVEMGQTIRRSLERLNAHPTYPNRFYQAYGVDRISSYQLTRAISAFQRTLISLNSPYDRYQYYGEDNALSASAKRGLELFYSEALQCGTCHSGFNFRKEGWENNGLFVEYPDSGRARITLDPADAGKFKVPSLRNVALTGPYMHDGSMASLSEIIDLYAAGGTGHRNQSPLIAGFEISDQEKADLMAFLESLTDESFLSNPDYAHPSIR